MDLEDLEPKKETVKLKDFTNWNIEDLEFYIENMEAEILRVKEMIKSKKKASIVADSLFKLK
ncbi:DUF1192 domain-containing protein [Alphaproteobacteria bacterium]|nr:DUF1192 domain-containing protein [Alphaproteobacteria bacterium]